MPETTQTASEYILWLSKHQCQKHFWKSQGPDTETNTEVICKECGMRGKRDWLHGDVLFPVITMELDYDAFDDNYGEPTCSLCSHSHQGTCQVENAPNAQFRCACPGECPHGKHPAYCRECVPYKVAQRRLEDAL